MKQQEQVQQPPLTRRQSAARQRAARIKEVNAAAKAWLAGRKDSKTPAADRLIARHIGKGWNEARAREILHDCLRFESENHIGRFETSYCSAEYVAYQLMRYGVISQRNNLTHVVAFMKEAGVPALYWEKAAAEVAAHNEAIKQERQRRRERYLHARTPSAAELEAEQADYRARMERIYLKAASAEVVAQAEAKKATPRGSKPVQLPLIETNEPARANETQVSTPNIINNNALAPEMVQKVVTYQKPIATEPATASMEVTVTPVSAESDNAPDEPPPSAPIAAEANLQAAQKAYNAADRACRAILRQRNPRLRAISREKGMLSLEARQAKAAVVAEYAEQLAEYEAELKRTTGLLVRMGYPPYPSATDDQAQEPVSREKCAVDDRPILPCSQLDTARYRHRRTPRAPKHRAHLNTART